jgi:transcriptional regulator with XRE-family HTH domain
MTADRAILKLVRNATGLTQAQLARRIRLSQSYVSLIENGNRRLTDRVLRRVNKIAQRAAAGGR